MKREVLPERSLLCAMLEQTLSDYKALLRHGVVKKGERIGSIQDTKCEQHVLGIYHDIEVDELLRFIKDGNFRFCMSICYGDEVALRCVKKIINDDIPMDIFNKSYHSV